MIIKAKRRAVYKYICIKCKKRRIAFKYTRAVDRICAKCERLNKINNNQIKLPFYERFIKTNSV